MRQDSTFDEIDMEDLHGNDNNAGIALDMKNRQRYFEGRSGPLEPVTNTDFKLSVRSMKSQLNEWKLGLKNVSAISQRRHHFKLSGRSLKTQSPASKHSS